MEKVEEFTFDNPYFTGRPIQEFVREWDIDASKPETGIETADFDKEDFINKLRIVEEISELPEKR